ncbi:hypothetical protein JX266_013074 [Neoarthrinium moseri]|nr:hypothetical protein JX266_013074 [Neoarthrinium moseri]
MISSQLTIVGCGVFGRAIVNGLLSDTSQSYSLSLTHRRPDAAKRLQNDYPNVLITTDNTDVRIWRSPQDLGTKHIVVIATQPRYTGDVCRDIRQAFLAADRTQQLVVVTVCPGITIKQLESWLPLNTSIVRAMPNTPIAVRQGATGIFPNQCTSSVVASEVQSIFKRMSPVVALLPREDLLDIVASISGSAPAYFFYLLQNLVASGAARGLPIDIGRDLVVQSCLGAAVLAQTAPRTTLLELLGHVCVPGGSTEKAIQTLDRFKSSMAIQAAVEESWHANCAMSKEALTEMGNIS